MVFLYFQLKSNDEICSHILQVNFVTDKWCATFFLIEKLKCLFFVPEFGQYIALTFQFTGRDYLQESFGAGFY